MNSYRGHPREKCEIKLTLPDSIIEFSSGEDKIDLIAFMDIDSIADLGLD